ncbi:MAG: hypothetical protein Q7T71_10255, partial [Herbiconiux sp.]|nr:hypothetical protein [Herbiconiux sp.]
MSGKARSGEGRASGADRRDDADARVGWDAWDARAEAAQRGLARSFGSPFARMGFRNGSRPLTVRPFTFNYWWFAHLIELRVDAFERSGDARWLDEAER